MADRLAMRMLGLVLLTVSMSLRAQAEYFRGLEALKRHDNAAAIQELTPPADAGEADAQNALGFAYDHDGTASGHARAAGMFRQAADGLLLGMLNLAKTLQAGQGGAPNPAEAAEWLTRAAGGGLQPAMVLLGDAYRRGVGVPVDAGNAQSWYERAAKGGDAAGMAELADMLLASPGPASQAAGLDWLQRAVAKGHPHAQQELALAKMLGSGGVPKDEPGAMELARSAAEHGDALAAAMLGESYSDGHGTTPSSAESARWYAEAARLGAVRGQIETARLKLASGPGRDPSEAFFWAQLAGRNPGQMGALISSVAEAAAREVPAARQAQLRQRAAEWRPGMRY